MKFSVLLVFLFLNLAAVSAQSTVRGGLSVYPNPATEFIQVNEGAESLDQLVMYNLVGKKVKDFDFVRGESYFVGDLPKGMYLVQFTDKNNRVLKTQKVDKR